MTSRKSLLSPDPAVRAANLLLLCVVLAENVFGLIDANAINVAGVINIDLVWQILLLVISVVLYHRSRCVPGTKTSAVQGVLFAALIVMCIFAAWRCNALTGQPFVRGILPQRGFMVCVLAAILLRRPFKAGLVDGKRLFQGLIILGCIASVLYLLQALAGSSVTFVHAASNERYGGIRLYIKGGLSTVSGIVGLWLCLRDGDWRYIIPTVLALAVTLFVSKGRLELVTYLVTLLVLFVFSRGSASIKVLVVCFGFLVLIFFSQTEMFGQVADSFVNGQVGGSEDTSSIRDAGRNYYDFVLQSTGSTFVGVGYPSTLYLPAISMAGFDYGYYLVDNGVSGFRYVYGDLGVAIVAVCLAFAVWFSWKNRNGHIRAVILAFLMFLALPAVNLAWWWNTSDWQVLTVIFVSLAWIRSGTWCSRLGGVARA